MFESHWFKHAFDFWNYEVYKCVFNKKKLIIFNLLKKNECIIYIMYDQDIVLKYLNSKHNYKIELQKCKIWVDKLTHVNGTCHTQSLEKDFYFATLSS